VKAGPKDNIRWRRKINRPESWSTLHWGPHSKARLCPKHKRLWLEHELSPLL
jgi:hypothetical protein